MKHMAFSVLIFMASMHAAYALPPQAEADMLMQEIGVAMKSGHYSDLADKFQRVHDLRARVQESFEFHWGKVLFETGRYADAMTHLDAYLTQLGDAGKYYVDALALYSKAKAKLAQQNKLMAEAKAAEDRQLAAQAEARRIHEEQIAQQNQRASAAAPELERTMVDIPVGAKFWTSIGYEVDLGLAAFQLGRTEVIQGQWQAIMGNNPSRFSGCGANCPVENVSYQDVKAFISKLNSLTSGGFRLPTKVEWMYACLAGVKTKYCGSDNPDVVGWYGANSGNQTHEVAQKAANAWGLFDMSGNVMELAGDCSPNELLGKTCNQDMSGNFPQYVAIGGAYTFYDFDLTSDAARDQRLNDVSDITGFRLARTR